jgi:uncharacterized protein YqeY
MLDRLRDDLKTAMKNRDEVTVRVMRMVLSDIHNREIAAGEELEESEILAALRKAVKLRSEAAEQFEAGGREEMAAAERAEIEVLEAYLPQLISGEDLIAAVNEVIGDVGAASMADMGKVMGALMERYQGRIDGRAASEAVKAKLA